MENDEIPLRCTCVRKLYISESVECFGELSASEHKGKNCGKERRWLSRLEKQKSESLCTIMSNKKVKGEYKEDKGFTLDTYSRD